MCHHKTLGGLISLHNCQGLPLASGISRCLPWCLCERESEPAASGLLPPTKPNGFSADPHPKGSNPLPRLPLPILKSTPPSPKTNNKPQTKPYLTFLTFTHNKTTTLYFGFFPVFIIDCNNNNNSTKTAKASTTQFMV